MSRQAPAVNTPPAPSLVTRAQRRIAFIQNKYVLIRDEVEALSPIDVVWNMHTVANVVIDTAKTTAHLTLNGQSLQAKIYSPSEAYFEVVTTNPGAPQATNDGISNLVIRTSSMIQNLTIEVVLSVADPSSANVLNLGDLNKWITDAIR